MSVIIIVADGARPDTLASAIDSGTLPALARLRAEGQICTVTSSFPSVTGPAYVPFLMGRYPGPAGLPGLRWYDRSRTRCTWPDYARSYVGHEARHLDGDLEPGIPSVFELVPSSLGALNVINKGLNERNRIGHGKAFQLRAAFTHFRGDLNGWLNIDRNIGSELVRRIREDKPEFVFAAFTGIDKTSHAAGHNSAVVQEAMAIVDNVVAQIRADAEHDRRWQDTHLWIVSDHGHSPVTQHEDLAGIVCKMGFKTIAHPWVFNPQADVAVMVSGNAMAHIYVDLDSRERRYWPDLRRNWGKISDNLLVRNSVDLLLLPHSEKSCLVKNLVRGDGLVEWENNSYSYTPVDGDPLELGELRRLSNIESYDATIASDYPDALVQIANISSAPRSGDIILSAARNWDFRAKHEPIPHVSSHGALHKEHMLVPLLTNRVYTGVPRRTVDVMPSTLMALGVALPQHLDGESYL